MWPTGFDANLNGINQDIDDDLLPPAVDSDTDDDAECEHGDSINDNIENIPVNYNRNALFNVNKASNVNNNKNL